MSEELSMNETTGYIHKRVILNGRVQGVGFRHYVKKFADKHSIDGWVRNLRDGRVQAELAGTEKGMDLILIELQKGPPASAVSQMEVEDLEEVEALTGEFTIRATV